MTLTHYIYTALALTATLTVSAENPVTTPSAAPTVAPMATADEPDTELLNRIYENEAYQRNIVSKMTFTLQTSRNNVSVPGQLRMRKDEVIRISLQVPFLGSEVGRLEFTPNEVLIIDRMHKQYVRAAYDEVAFLADNGITFYTLQALFWNKLTLPGEQSISYSNLSQFATASLDDKTAEVSVENGKLSYQWQAEKATGLLTQARVAYESDNHGTSTATWQYADFKAFGSKKFPYKQTITVLTGATGRQKSIAATLDLDGISTDDNWDATTTVSDRYTQVSVEEVLGKLISL